MHTVPMPHDSSTDGESLSPEDAAAHLAGIADADAGRVLSDEELSAELGLDPPPVSKGAAGVRS